MPSKVKHWDAFISHASEDKLTFVKPLADALAGFGAKIWYDDFTLTIGDSLSRSVDKGLADSRYGIVVLSPAFLAKHWPEYELRGLTAKEIGGEKVILPIWHNITRDDILAYSPPLADKKAILSSDGTPEQIALNILEVIRPDISTMVLKKIAYLEAIRMSKTVRVDPKKIKPAPHRHKDLPSDLIGRIRLIRAALWGAYTHSMDFWLDGFKRDTHPEREVAWWEHVAACYTEVSKITPLKPEQHESLFNVILELCSGFSEDEISDEMKALPEDAVKKIRNVIKYRLPVYDIEENFPKEMDQISDEVLKELSDHDIDNIPMK